MYPPYFLLSKMELGIEIFSSKLAPGTFLYFTANKPGMQIWTGHDNHFLKASYSTGACANTQSQTASASISASWPFRQAFFNLGLQANNKIPKIQNETATLCWGNHDDFTIHGAWPCADRTVGQLASTLATNQSAPRLMPQPMVCIGLWCIRARRMHNINKTVVGFDCFA